MNESQTITTRTNTTNSHTNTMIEGDHDILPECFAYLELNEILRCVIVSHTWNRIILQSQKRIFSHVTYVIKRLAPIQLPLRYRCLIRRIHLDLPQRKTLTFTAPDSPVSLVDFNRVTKVTVSSRVGRRSKDLPTLFELLSDTPRDGSTHTPVVESTVELATVGDVASTSNRPSAPPSTPPPSPIVSLQLCEQNDDFVPGLLSHPRVQMLEELTLNDSLSLEDVTAIGTLTHLKRLVCTNRVDLHFYHVIHNLPSLTTLGIPCLPLSDIEPLPSQLLHLTVNALHARLPIPYEPLSSLTQLQTFDCSVNIMSGVVMQHLMVVVEWLSQLRTLQSINLNLSSTKQIPSIQVLNCLTPLVCHNNHSELVVSELNLGGLWLSEQKVSFRRRATHTLAASNTVKSVPASKTTTNDPSNTNVIISASPPPTSISGLLHSWRFAFTHLTHLTLVLVPFTDELAETLKELSSLRTFSFQSSSIASPDTIMRLFQVIGQQTSLVKLSLDLSGIGQANSLIVPPLCHSLTRLTALEEFTFHPSCIIDQLTPCMHDQWDKLTTGPLFIQTLLVSLPHLKRTTSTIVNGSNFLHFKEIEQLQQAGIKFTQ